ncbi:MAG: hypothetical protein KGL39_22675 [Patescibacteria group bacterium]|nr:hypothetical protein [Patescibacteria group bacterium]
MAYEIPGLVITLTAAADLSTSQYKFVKLDSTGKAAAIAAVTDIPIGVLQNAPASGASASVMVYGVTKVQGAADLARGNQIGPSVDGQAAAYVAGTDTTKYIVGQVLEDNSAAGGYATATINCAAPHRGA